MICPECGSGFTYIKPDSNTYGCKACEAKAEKEYEAKRRKYINDNPSAFNEDIIAWENKNKPNVKETFSFGRVVGTEGQCPWCHSTDIVEKVYRRKKADQVKTCSNSRVDKQSGNELNHITEEFIDYEANTSDDMWKFEKSNFERTHQATFTYQVIEDKVICFPYDIIFPLRQIAEFYKIRSVSK